MMELNPGDLFVTSDVFRKQCSHWFSLANVDMDVKLTYVRPPRYEGDYYMFSFTNRRGHNKIVHLPEHFFEPLKPFRTEDHV